MKDDIARKLNDLISEGKDFDERTATYFFAEVRKIIEHLSVGLSKEERKRIYPIVKFYADWCLHIKKDNTQDFRDYMECIVATVEKDLNMSFVEFITSLPRHGLAPLVELEELKSQLADFLEDNGITHDFLNDRHRWLSFRNALGKVLAEQPLDFGENPIGSLRVKEVSFMTTNPKMECAFLISMKNSENEELGPFIFGDTDPDASF